MKITHHNRYYISEINWLNCSSDLRSLSNDFFFIHCMRQNIDQKSFFINIIEFYLLYENLKQKGLYMNTYNMYIRHRNMESSRSIFSEKNIIFFYF